MATSRVDGMEKRHTERLLRYFWFRCLRYWMDHNPSFDCGPIWDCSIGIEMKAAILVEITEARSGVKLRLFKKDH